MLIQTDKPVYKPGDTVNYRILVLNSETKPFNYAKIRTKICDSNGNVMKTISKNNQPNQTKGKSPVYKEKFELAADTILGEWKLFVIVNNDKSVVTEKAFKVEKYVLPRFEIIIDTKPHVARAEGKILINVSAKYTFGKPVEGRAWFKKTIVEKRNENVFPAENITLPETLQFEITKLLRILKIEIIFEETLTGITTNKEVEIQVHNNDVNLMISRSDGSFRPGFPFEFEVTVIKLDGTLEQTSAERVKVSTTMYGTEHPSALYCGVLTEFSHEYELVNGKAKIVINVLNNTAHLKISASYKNSKASPSLFKEDSVNKEFVKASLKAP